MAGSKKNLPTNEVGIKLGGRKLDVHIVNISVTPRAQITRAPIADRGTDIYLIDQPTRIVCKCALKLDPEDKWMSTLSRIQAFYNRSEIDPSNTTHLAQITTRSEVYDRCALVSCPHDESPDCFDTFYFTLTFEELNTVY